MFIILQMLVVFQLCPALSKYQQWYYCIRHFVESAILKTKYLVASAKKDIETFTGQIKG